MSKDAYCLTDKGLVRKRNEDVCSADIEHNFFTVADGMGGTSGGDIASKLFLKATREIYDQEKDQWDVEGAKERVYTVFRHANSMILNHVQQHPVHKGMGCTGELLTFGPSVLFWDMLATAAPICIVILRSSN